MTVGPLLVMGALLAVGGACSAGATAAGDTREVPEDGAGDADTSDTIADPADDAGTGDTTGGDGVQDDGAGDGTTIDGGDTVSDAGPDSGGGCPAGGAWPRRILLIGNSYTSVNHLGGALATLLETHPCAGGTGVFADEYAPGGYRLPQELADANDPSNALYGKLRDPAGWDVVVMQDQSQIPGFNDGDPLEVASLEALPGLVSLAHDAGAAVVLLMTWGHRDGDTNNPGLYPDYATMQARLAAGYATYAAYATTATGVPISVAPAGLAWQAVHDDDFAPPVASEVAAARFAGLYAPDGSHPSPRGTYLAAATLLVTLTGQSPAAATGAPGVDQADKAWLDEAAERATRL